MKAMKGWAHLIGLGVLLFGMSGATMAANMCRWVDASGMVHYSDQSPPPDAKEFKCFESSEVGEYENDYDADSDEGDASSDGPSYEAEEEAFQQRQAERAEEEAKQQQAQAEAEQRKKNCDLARSNYNTISVGGRITRVNADGEREFLTDEEIEKETATARATMQKWCDE